jgi:signal transduction histidine kinase
MAARLTRLLDERARTLAAIGHDLRSPITAMRLRIEMVDDDETRERLSASVDEMQTLVEGALSLARGGGADEPTEIVDLRGLLEDLVARLTEAGAAAALDAPAAVAVPARPMALKRALRNLAENAARYGGAARIALTPQDGAALIAVEDDGPGVPPEDRERVFEPFVRLEGSRSRDTGGAGLGLAIARAAIEGMGGAVWLEAAAGGGTRAVVTLPDG